MDKYRFKQLLESSMGNVKPLITEDDDKIQIFLNKYIGKTFNLYNDENLQNIWGTFTIDKIYYETYPQSQLVIEFGEDTISEVKQKLVFICTYNPSKFNTKSYFKIKNYKDDISEKPVYNKSLTTDIFTKATQAGIQFCQKPKADFGSTNPLTNPKNDLT